MSLSLQQSQRLRPRQIISLLASGPISFNHLNPNLLKPSQFSVCKKVNNFANRTLSTLTIDRKSRIPNPIPPPPTEGAKAARNEKENKGSKDSNNSTNESSEPMSSQSVERIDPPKYNRSDIEKLVINEAKQRAALNAVLRNYRKYNPLSPGRLGRRDKTITNELQYQDWLKEVELKYDVNFDYDELQYRLLEADDEMTDNFFDEANPFISVGDDIVNAGKVATTSEDIDRKENEVEFIRTKFDHWYRVDYRRHVIRTFRGKEESFSCLILAGDGKGLAGFGLGRKAADSTEAEVKATLNIRKTLMFLPMMERRTITRHYVGKFGTTFVKVWPCVRGYGMTAGKIPWAIFECFGLEDITAKVHGRVHHLRHQVYATFDALANQPSARDICLARGESPFRLFEPHYYLPKPFSQEEAEERRSQVRDILYSLRDNPRYDAGFPPEKDPEDPDYDEQYSFDQRIVARKHFRLNTLAPRD